jgi:Holliday junction DNA helicase RuvA
VIYGFRGLVEQVKEDYIILKTTNVYLKIYVIYPFSYIKNKDYTIYTKTFINENKAVLYGFKTLIERELFAFLISVKGIGPKTALKIMSYAPSNVVIDSLKKNNINFFRRIKISERKIEAIFEDYQKLKPNKINQEEVCLGDIYTTLLELGYAKEKLYFYFLKNEFSLNLPFNHLLNVTLKNIPKSSYK